MRLDSISLQNYRCFDNLQVNLHPQLTVLVAPNGQGKTTVLDAIRVLFDTYLGAFPTGVGKGIRVSDVRLAKTSNVPYTMAAAFPCKVYGYGSLVDGQEPINWSRSINSTKSGTTIKDAKSLALHGKKLQALAQNTSVPTDWPLLAYYGTGRLWDKKKLTSGKVFASGFFDRAAGYIDCLEPASSYKLFVNWFGYAYRAVTQAKIRFMEANPTATPQQIVGLQSEFSPLIDAVSEAVNQVLRPTGWGNIWYSETHKDVTASHPDFGVLAVSQLSDGIRNSLAMAADMAFRSVQLNPHLGADAARKTSGIVMIDEVDMHLHPSWQQTVLTDLMVAFPKLQFIVTTHSPQVLTSVDAACIRKLVSRSNPDTGAQTVVAENVSLQTRGVASADLLARIMAVDPVPDVPEARQLADYHELIQQNLHESSEAQTLREALNTHFGPDHPVMQECDRLIRLQAFKQRLPVQRATVGQG